METSLKYHFESNQYGLYLELLNQIKQKPLKSIYMSQLEEQVNRLRAENQQLQRQLDLKSEENSKWINKYQKALKQMALIVRANENLKFEYDQIERNQQNLITKALQQNKQHTYELVKREFEGQVHALERLSFENQQLKIESNSLSIKANTLELEKNKLEAEKQDLARRYQSAKLELERANPETHHLHQIKQKVDQVEELREAVSSLRAEKQEISTLFKQKVQEVERLWNEWRAFQRELQNPKDSSTAQRIRHPSFQQKNETFKCRISESRQTQKTSLTGNADLESYKEEKKNRELEEMRTKYEQIQQQVEEFEKLRRKAEKEHQEEIIRLRSELKEKNKQIMEIRRESDRSRIKQSFDQMSVPILDQQQKIKEIETIKQRVNNEEELLPILKDLHEQLSPLKREIANLKRRETENALEVSRDKANLEVKVIKYEKELEFYKDHNNILKAQLNESKLQKASLQEARRIQAELEEKKNILQGRVVVLEAMSIADRTRTGSETYNSLKEFERRIELMVEDPNVLSDLEGNHLQQLIAMKAYVLELDQRLKGVARENSRLLKKYQAQKDKVFHLSSELKQLENSQTTRNIMYRQKINSYDKLVQKLTVELEKNISSTKANSEAEEEFTQVVELYERKMTKMGEQLMKLKEARKAMDEECKALRVESNRLTRLLNDKDSDLVMHQTKSINLEGKVANLEKENLELRLTNQIFKDNKDYKGESLEKSRMLSIMEGENKVNRLRLEEENQKLKEMYEREIQSLRNTIFEIERKLSEVRHQKETLERENESTNRDSHLTQTKSEILISELQNRVRELEGKLSSYERERTSRSRVSQDQQSERNRLHRQFDEVEERYLMTIKTLENKLNQLEGEKLTMFDQLSESRMHENETLDTVRSEYQKQIKALEDRLQERFENIVKLENQILKKNHEIDEMRTEQRSKVYGNTHFESSSSLVSFSSPKDQQRTREILDENKRLENLNYELNVKISGLQSTIYNIRLENERYRGQVEILLEKVSKLENEIRIKNSKILTLESQVRNASNTSDSTLLAKDSLIRSYENEISSLKKIVQELKVSSQNLTQEKLSRIQELQNDLNESRMRLQGIQKDRSSDRISESKIYEDRSSSDLERLAQIKAESEKLKGQHLQHSKQLAVKNEQIRSLERKMESIHTELKLKEDIIADKDQIIENLSQKLRSKNENLSSIMETSEQGSSILYSEEIEKLSSQILVLRADAISLNDTIESKEQLISELKHEIYQSKLDTKKNERYENQIQELKNEITKLRLGGSSTFRASNKALSSSHIYSQSQGGETLNQLTGELNAVKKENETLMRTGKETIDRLQKEIEALQLQIEDYKNKENSLMHEMSEEFERLRRTNADNESERCKMMAVQIDALERGIQAVKQDYEKEVHVLQSKIKTMELTGVSEQKHPSQESNQYLVGEIERLSAVLKGKTQQVEELSREMSRLQSIEKLYQENLSVMVLMFAEIESLRDQVIENRSVGQRQLEEVLEKLKIKKVDSVQDLVNFDLVREIDCTHQHIANYERDSLENRKSRSKFEQYIGAEHSHQSNDTRVVSGYLRHSPSSRNSTPKQDVSSQSYKKFAFNYEQSGSKNSVDQLHSQNSSVNNSQQKITESDSVQKSPSKALAKPKGLSNMYRKAESKYQNDNSRIEAEQNAEASQEDQASNTSEQFQPIKFNLHSYGKISESQNVDSSIGSSIGSMSYGDGEFSSSPEKGEYRFRLKDVEPNSQSGISGVGNSSNISRSSSYKTIYANGVYQEPSSVRIENAMADGVNNVSYNYSRANNPQQKQLNQPLSGISYVGSSYYANQTQLSDHSVPTYERVTKIHEQPIRFTDNGLKSRGFLENSDLRSNYMSTSWKN